MTAAQRKTHWPLCLLSFFSSGPRAAPLRSRTGPPAYSTCLLCSGVETGGRKGKEIISVSYCAAAGVTSAGEAGVLDLYGSGNETVKRQNGKPQNIWQSCLESNKNIQSQWSQRSPVVQATQYSSTRTLIWSSLFAHFCRIFKIKWMTIPAVNS